MEVFFCTMYVELGRSAESMARHSYGQSCLVDFVYVCICVVFALRNRNLWDRRLLPSDGDEIDVERDVIAICR